MNILEWSCWVADSIGRRNTLCLFDYGTGFVIQGGAQCEAAPADSTMPARWAVAGEGGRLFQ